MTTTKILLPNKFGPEVKYTYRFDWKAWDLITYLIVKIHSLHVDPLVLVQYSLSIQEMNTKESKIMIDQPNC